MDKTKIKIIQNYNKRKIQTAVNSKNYLKNYYLKYVPILQRSGVISFVGVEI